MFVIFVGSEPEGAVVEAVPMLIHAGFGLVGQVSFIKGIGGAELGVAS